MVISGKSVNSTKKQALNSKYLTQVELENIFKAARKRCDRDYAVVFFSYRHALRCSELLALRWDCVDWRNKRIGIWRAKKSQNSFHELAKDEISLLKKLKKQSQSDFIIAGRQSNSSPDNGLSTSRVRQMCKEMGIESGLKRRFHHHMLRHTCAIQMAENANINPLMIQRFLGHRDSKSTQVYIDEAGRDLKNLGVWWN